MEFFELLVIFIVAEEEGAGDIRTIALEFASEVDENGIAELKFARPRFIVRHTAVFPECADGIERDAARAEFSHVIFEKRRDLGFRHALFQVGKKQFEAILGDLARPLDFEKLLFRLDKHGALESGHAIHRLMPFLLIETERGDAHEGIGNAERMIGLRRFKRFAVSAAHDLDRAILQRLLCRLEVTKIGEERAFIRGEQDIAVRGIEIRQISAEEIAFHKNGVDARVGIEFA